MRFPFKVIAVTTTEKGDVKVDLQTQYGDSTSVRYPARDLQRVQTHIKVDNVLPLEVVARNYEGRSFIAPVAPSLVNKPLW